MAFIDDLYPSVRPLAELYKFEVEGDTGYDIRYEIDMIIEERLLQFALTNVIDFDLGEPEPVKERNPFGGHTGRYIITVMAEGVEGLVRIINFDRLIVETNLAMILNEIHLSELEADRRPTLFNKLSFGFRNRRSNKNPLPTFEDIHEEVKQVYTEAGIYFP